MSVYKAYYKYEGSPLVFSDMYCFESKKDLINHFIKAKVLLITAKEIVSEEEIKEFRESSGYTEEFK